MVRNKTDASSVQMCIVFCEHNRHIAFVMNIVFVIDNVFSEKYIFFSVLTINSAHLHYFTAAVSFIMFLILNLSAWVHSI